MAKKPHKLTNLDFSEVSLVDTPANPGARVILFKRDDPVRAAMVAKAQDAGARNFAEVLAETEERRQRWEAQEQLWPLFEALQASLGSIAADENLSRDNKLSRIEQSVGEFLAAVREQWPEVEQELEKLLKADPAVAGFFVAGNPAGDHIGKTGDISMPDDNKKVADLEKSVAALKTQIEELNGKLEKSESEKVEAQAIAKMGDAERDHLKALKGDDRKEFLEMTPAKRRKAIEKAAEGDEVVNVGGVAIRKSVVGEAQFSVIKDQQARLDKQDEEIKKAREEGEMTRLEKRATDEFGLLPGEAIAKAKVLKHIAGADEATRATLDAMLKAGQEAIKAAFATAGHRGGGVPTEDSAEGKLEKLAKARAEKDGTSFEVAYQKVLETPEGSKLYTESLGEPKSKAA